MGKLDGFFGIPVADPMEVAQMGTSIRFIGGRFKMHLDRGAKSYREDGN